MSTISKSDRFPKIGDGSGVAPDDKFFREEVQLALRNPGMPLEAMRYPITPTGMHYHLIHFDVPDVDVDLWRLQVGVLAGKMLSLTLDQLRGRPAVTMPVTMECAGNGRTLLGPRPISQPWTFEAIGTAEWTGTPLRGVLEEAGLENSAIEVLFTGLDRGVQGDEVQYYQRSLTIDEAMREEVLLAYEMNGAPLEPQHGYPLRLLVPGWYGMTSVKWLHSIEAISEPFEGYQQAIAYRYTQDPDDPGEPVTTQVVRALMIPPGIPDFATRVRLLEPGPVILHGRAWAGRRSVTRVEVSVDAGESWSDAELGDQAGRFAWQGWSAHWLAAPGRYELLVRATDDAGRTQPVEQPWNLQGLANNMAQRVAVVVE